MIHSWNLIFCLLILQLLQLKRHSKSRTTNSKTTEITTLVRKQSLEFDFLTQCFSRHLLLLSRNTYPTTKYLICYFQVSISNFRFIFELKCRVMRACDGHLGHLIVFDKHLNLVWRETGGRQVISHS